MDYSIAFFSETPFNPATKILRSNKNMRTDLNRILFSYIYIKGK